jgi:hypothetical protein
VQKLVQDAADKAGFSVYCHKGHRLHDLRRVDAEELPCHVRAGDMQAGAVREWF